MLRRSVATFAILLAASVCGASPSTAATGVAPGLGIRLVDAPVALQDDPRARVYIIDHVHPGETFTRHVDVTNGTATTAHVLLYPDAADVNGGSFNIAPGHGVNELTRWITVSPPAVDIPPNGSVRVEVSLRVPATPTIGEHYAAILAEQDTAATAPGIRLARRVGIRVYLSVGRGGAPASDFAITDLSAGRTPDGRPVVTADVKNTGGRALDMSGKLWLKNGPGGLSAGPFPAKLGTTLGIGQTEPVTVQLDRAMPAGPWLAHLELQSDLIKHAAEATITFPAAAGTFNKPVKAKPVPLTANKHLLGIVAGSLILLVVLGILFFLFLLWRRREDQDRDRRRAGPTPPTLPAQRSEQKTRTRSRR